MSAPQSPAMALCLALLNSGQSRQAIAEAIGYSRPAVSRYLLGTYGEVREIEAEVIRDHRDECEAPQGIDSLDARRCRCALRSVRDARPPARGSQFSAIMRPRAGRSPVTAPRHRRLPRQVMRTRPLPSGVPAAASARVSAGGASGAGARVASTSSAGAR